MKINTVVIFITFFFSFHNYASYIDENGEPVNQWFSVDFALMIKEVDPLRLKFTDDYFKNWFYTYMYNKKMKNQSLKKIHERFEDFFIEFNDQSADCAVPSLCEIIKEVGIQRTIKMIYLYEVYGINTTHHKKTVGPLLEYLGTYSPFTDKELLSLIIAAELFKENFHYLSEQELVMTYSNYKTDQVANAVITFFEKWRGAHFYEKVAGTLHELYHVLDGFSFYTQADMKGILLENDQEWKEIANTCYVSRYARANEAEDIAESLFAYFHNKAYLDQVCPEKSKVIKRVLEEAKTKIEQVKVRRSSLEYKVKNAIRSFFF